MLHSFQATDAILDSLQAKQEDYKQQSRLIDERAIESKVFCPQYHILVFQAVKPVP